ncbi:MAG: TPM domain-containing protein [Paludibacteraceae bacterium]|nr:TPM domain-containing protein [Paludibacteraceae bacterium]
MKKFLLFLALAAMTFAQAATYTPKTVPDPKKQGQEYYVSNPDGIISAEYETYLNELSQSLYKKTLVELATVALESIGDMDAFDFSYELFQRWGIGGEGRNTGVLILFVLDSHDIQIRTGTGIEGVLTDAQCSQIIRTQMVPWFKEGDYKTGLMAGALDIYLTCTDGEVPEELQTIKSVTYRAHYDEEDEEDEDDNSSLFILAAALIVFLFFIFLAYWQSLRKCPKCNKRKAERIRTQTLVHATYSHGGKERNTYKCKHCGHEFTIEEDTPHLTHSSASSSSSSSRGGYSSSSRSSGGSWGGGSTSGGGAGGKW